MTDGSERAKHIRREIAAVRELCERRAWSESELRSRNTCLIASVPGLLTMLEETLAQLVEMTAARNELHEIAAYFNTYIPKFPPVGGPTSAERRIAELLKVGAE